jgi:type I restriction enzyme R subunit
MASSVGERERFTQNRIIKLFQNQLGYTYAGNWEDRANNSNIEEPWLRTYLIRNGYSTTLINKALDRLRSEANNYGRRLYDNNKEVYQLLRYGIPVQEELGHKRETVHVINWKYPQQNDF